MRLYVAGPMRGIPEFNFPAFAEAAAGLRRCGHDVVSPHEKDLKVDGFDPTRVETLEALDLAETMRWDLRTILDCDGIVMLPGWERSQGARLERIVAESTGRRVFLYDPTTLGGLVPASPWDNPVIFAPGRRL